ncbi:porin family protein [Dysgonomonas sp. 511]|uniref:porin family protein n=1 Tax=Dysgonomonas sp. 511 TaxID=2302930 RepID=UPI0013D64865|nr:porin family protein [Dysgonomonas sp. 511]NDV79774.1 PorT family protein [Dysgonomonas sp. 511]
MKKILSIIVTILLFNISVYAQFPGVTFGVKVGGNFSNLSGDLDDTKARIGALGGATVDIYLTDTWYLLSGLELNLKGAKWNADYTIENQKVGVENKATTLYLQLPVHIAYKMDILDDSKLVFHAGPYFAYGLKGRTTIDTTIEGKTTTEKIGFFGDDRASRFDFGLGAGAGIELFERIPIGIGFDFGLANIYNGDDDLKMRNMSAYLSVGYKF